MERSLPAMQGAEPVAAAAPPQARAETARAAGAIVAFAPAHLPGVAGLFQRSFRDARQATPAGLAAYLEALFLDDRMAEPDLASRVCIAADGAVAGFIGALPLRMTLAGAPVRALTASTLMVDRPAENPTIGARLVRAFLAGPQDLSLTDTASPLVRAMWLRLGGAAVDSASLDWWRVLRPAGFAAQRLDGKRRLPLLAPLSRLLDPVVARLAALAPLPEPPAGFRSEEVDAARFADAFASLAPPRGLRPDWSREALARRLDHARRRSDGTRLVLRATLDRRGALAGCAAYHTRRGGVARVLDLAARPGAHGVVLADLLADARAAGAVALRGRARPELTEALLQQRCFYTHRLSTVVHARRPELLAAAQAGDAVLTGLAGDTWTRLFGDDFA